MIVGREKELKLLERAYRANEAQFITVYGRRRVGKTYLIREFFTHKECIFFHITGLQKASLEKQLENFAYEFSRTFLIEGELKTPSSWNEAFKMLDSYVKEIQKKVVILFDELPWMATRKSDIKNQIDYFWNNKWSGQRHIIFIACGSSASWLIKNILYDKGGLHNRTTIEIQLAPFNLLETKQFLASKKVLLSDENILSLYMAVGGIPYYLGYSEPGQTAQQIIQSLFFDENAPLEKEFRKLFDSLFTKAEPYKELIEVISKKKSGLTEAEIGTLTKLSSSGGTLSRKLQNLCDAGFLKKNKMWGKTRLAYYQVIDEFCLFYLRWIDGHSGNTFDQNHWLIQSQRPAYYTWAGYAFEAVCSKHIHHIIRGLGITMVNIIGSWCYKQRNSEGTGAQIDLMIDRIDDGVTLCEIKYTKTPFVVDKSYAQILTNKVAVFKKQTKITKQVFIALVSAHGIKPNLYSEELISGVVTLEDLFKQYI